jgi:carboxymethylenebutenolidase
VVGFCVDRLDELDPDAPEQAAIWQAPCFDAPALGLTGVVAGEVAVAARAWFGGEDSFDRRLARIATAARASVPTDVVRYPDAGHGFHCDARDAYHEASAKDGWDRTLAFFAEHLQG